MPAPTVDDFWRAVVRTRLLEADAVERLRAEHAALPPAGAGAASIQEVALWLVGRGVLTRWQAAKLVAGEAGPFRLGGYRLLERHERSGETLVFTARHESTGRPVTLVVFNAKRCRDPLVAREITSRAAIAAAARDPMLVRTGAVEQADGSWFVPCEPIAGGSLADEVQRLGPLPPEEAGAIAWQAARAVAELHALGGVHGGLSLDALHREPPPAGGDARQGQLRLMQFPLAYDPHLVPLRIPVEDPAAIERLGRRAAYVAPELVSTDAVCDARSDVYAIGGVLVALLTGREPGRAGAAAATLATAASRAAPPLPAAVPDAMRSLAARMLDRDPSRRPATAKDVADELARCLGVLRPPPPPPIPSQAGGDGASQPPVVELPVVRASSGAMRPRRAGRGRTQRKAGWLPWIGVALATSLVIGAVAFFGLGIGSGIGKPRARGPAARGAKPGVAARPTEDQAAGRVAAADQPQAPAAAPPSPRQIVVDDTSLPWESPTTGPPPDLAYLPPGAEVVLLVRLADVAADDEGRLFLRSLGPAVESGLARLVTLCGGDIAAIDRVQAAWQVEEGDEVVGGCAVWFTEASGPPADDAARQRAWGPTVPNVIDEETVFVGETHSFWLPRAEDGRVMVIASTTPPVAGGEPPMTRIIRESAPLAADESLAVKAVVPVAMETLVGMLDGDRHVTLLASPQTLMKTGRGILAGPLARLAAPLDVLCGDSLQAAAVSLHFGDSCYVELDAVASPDLPAPRLARELAARLEGLAGRVEAAVATLGPDPYGRDLVRGLPAMLRILTGQIRGDAEGKGAVLNAYLPRHAAHNIALAAELALAQAARGGDAGRGGTAPAAAARAVERLGTRTTLSFARDSLERAIAALAEETGVSIEILGGDLEIEGITRNQSFALDERDKTADEILRVILAKANPEGKLVYVIQERDGVERVLITTRAAAEKRSDTLPPGFVPHQETGPAGGATD